MKIENSPTFPDPYRPIVYWVFAFVFGFFLTMATAGAGPIPPEYKELHILNRLGFGPAPSDLAHIRATGVDRYIDEQLSLQSIPLTKALDSKLESLSTLRMSAPELFVEYGPPSIAGPKGDKQAAKAARQRARIIVEQATEAHVLRAVESPRQLEEVMVNFWFNHFNIFAQKGLDYLWTGSYEEQAIRPYALGRFRDLLGATAKHPAMLFYLDNWQNTAPNSPGARGNFKGINENYARELMELHTLGVNGGYTQDDVITLARILTGWGFRRPGQGAQPYLPKPSATLANNGFYFDRNRHDFSSKSFLGHQIKGTGIAEGEEALDLLAQHPSTARHISYKLAQYFVADEPPASLVEALTQEYLVTGGDIRSVLKKLFRSPEFWDEQYANKKFKTPYEFVISAVRASGVSVSNAKPLLGTMGQLGMPLYGCLTPDGYKNTQAAWLNPNAMTQRLNFATALSAGRMPLDQPINVDQMDGSNRSLTENQVKAPQPIDSTKLINLLGNTVSAQTRAKIENSRPALRAALILGGPDFMYR
jgi:uncharacterized protein (DUF1800 family)